MKSEIRSPKPERIPKSETVRLFAALCAALATTVQLHAATLATDFATDPLAAGWQVHGTNNLFAWDSTNGNLRVTWDSSKPNSYFYHPLGRTLTRADGFLLTFDLTLTDVPVMNGFQLALGMINFSDATSPNFFRGSGYDSPNLAQFSYFPDFMSINADLTDTNCVFSFSYASQTLELGTTYRIVLIHLPNTDSFGGQVLTNGQVFITIPQSTPYAGFTDFQLDTLAVSSYSHVNGYGASILAHGIVDNLAVASPLPIGTLSMPAAPNQVAFSSDSSWNYTLEVSTNFTSWSSAASAPGNGTTLTLQDTNPPAAMAVYRVRASLQ